VILLKPQDVAVVLKTGVELERLSFAVIARDLRISVSEAHAATNRAAAAALLDLQTRRPRTRNFFEFLRHGLSYVFISRRGEITRGVPTAGSAPPLSAHLSSIGTEISLVWPHPQGEVRGESFEPLYPSAVDAALHDQKLYECLALIDAVRIGRVREKELALELLAKAMA
jgi:hypothetical protein